MEPAIANEAHLAITLLRQIPGNFVILLPNSPHFTIVEMSDTYNTVAHTTRNEIIGKGLFEVFPDNLDNPASSGAQNLKDSLLKVLNSKETHQMPIQQYDVHSKEMPGFEPKYWLSVNKPVIIDDQVAYIIHSTEDITEHKLLNVSETFFKALAEESPFMIFRCVDGRCTYVNKAWIGITGLSLADSYGAGYLQAFHPDDILAQDRLFRKATTSLSVYESKYRLLRKDGEIRWVIAKASPYFIDGQCIEYIGSIIDITDEELARRESEERAAQFHQLADSIVQMVWVTDPNGMHEYYNQRWYDFTGTGVEETQGEGWNKMFHPDDRARAWEKWSQSLSTGQIYEIEYRLLKHTGEYVWVLGRAAPIYDREGKITKWFGTCTDIHEQKKLQKDREEFISIASHELRTPITTLTASLQLLDRQIKKDKNTNPITNKMIISANESVKKLSRLVSDLLDVTKIEQGQLILNKQWFAVNDLISHFCERMNGGPKIICTGNTEMHLWADLPKLEQVIVNLVNNCVKYAPQSREINIHTESSGDYVKISVKDFGPGIPEDQLSQLFAAYYRGDNNGQQYSGLGLGLYICSTIISNHGGKMGVESELNKGSTFWFTIPV